MTNTAHRLAQNGPTQIDGGRFIALRFKKVRPMFGLLKLALWPLKALIKGVFLGGCGCTGLLLGVVTVALVVIVAYLLFF